PLAPSVPLYIQCFVTFLSLLFFFTATATPEIYTLSLHDALPICSFMQRGNGPGDGPTRVRSGAKTGARRREAGRATDAGHRDARSEEHTSELQSHLNLVCRLLLEKKKQNNNTPSQIT